MRSLIPRRNKKKELAGRGGQATPMEDLAFSLSRMREEFDRFFDRASREYSSLAAQNGEGWQWGLEVADEDDKVVVRAEAPGFDAEDFDLRVEDGQLILRASKRNETKDEEGNVREYDERECYESVALPEGIDQENIDAKYHNGVLTVTLQKTDVGRAKRIAVKAT